MKFCCQCKKSTTFNWNYCIEKQPKLIFPWTKSKKCAKKGRKWLEAKSNVENTSSCVQFGDRDGCHFMREMFEIHYDKLLISTRTSLNGTQWQCSTFFNTFILCVSQRIITLRSHWLTSRIDCTTANRCHTHLFNNSFFFINFHLKMSRFYCFFLL